MTPDDAHRFDGYEAPSNTVRFHQATEPLDLGERRVVGAYILGVLIDEVSAETFEVILDSALQFAREADPMRVLHPCGTYGGYQRHRRAGEAACEKCLDAHRRYKAEWRNRNPESRERDIADLRVRREATRLLIERHEAEFRLLLADIREASA